MAILRRDGWQDDPYKTIYGDLALHQCKITFTKVKFKRDSKGFMIYGYIDCVQGIVRSYLPDLPCDLALTKILIHHQPYTTKVKQKDGSYEFIKRNPSRFEQQLYFWLNQNSQKLNLENNYFGGYIHFIPDHHSLFDSDSALNLETDGLIELNVVASDGSIPDLISNQKTNKVQPQNGLSTVNFGDREVLIKKTILQDLKNTELSHDASWINITEILLDKFNNDQLLIQTYLTVLKLVYR